MNCPRLTDSLLEKCGSRRMVKRAEIDVREKERGVKDMATWAAAVDAALGGPENAVLALSAALAEGGIAAAARAKAAATTSRSRWFKPRIG